MFTVVNANFDSFTLNEYISVTIISEKGILNIVYFYHELKKLIKETQIYVVFLDVCFRDELGSGLGLFGCGSFEWNNPKGVFGIELFV